MPRAKLGSPMPGMAIRKCPVSEVGAPVPATGDLPDRAPRDRLLRDEAADMGLIVLPPRATPALIDAARLKMITRQELPCARDHEFGDAMAAGVLLGRDWREWRGQVHDANRGV